MQLNSSWINLVDQFMNDFQQLLNYDVSYFILIDSDVHFMKIKYYQIMIFKMVTYLKGLIEMFIDLHFTDFITCFIKVIKYLLKFLMLIHLLEIIHRFKFRLKKIYCLVEPYYLNLVYSNFWVFMIFKIITIIRILSYSSFMNHQLDLEVLDSASHCLIL